MKQIIIGLLLVAVLASCGTMRKNKSSFRQETAKHELSTRDSAGTSLVESFVKKVDSSHAIEKEESGYEKEIEEETFEIRVPKKAAVELVEGVDTAGLTETVVVRQTKKTIREKGLKVKETTQQAAVKEEQQAVQQRAAQVTNLNKVDTSAAVAVSEKHVKRSGLPWWAWGLIVMTFLALIYRYRYKILGAWNWALYRLIGRKPPNNATR
ncbi:MAG: hypothetical protein ACTHMC_12375 [Pseudobacter sp.]|uniref:hypothetical protein n=1 Tax=Pseudobacter sp. TaxID=2045420 RepID=UPI003F80CD7C